MNELLSTGIEVMLIGMGIVYSFLAMLVVAIKSMSNIVNRYFPDVHELHPAIKQSSNNHEDPALIAAISAAVKQYRKKHHHRD